MSQPVPHKKIREMSLEERRTYNRESRRRSRERHQAERQRLRDAAMEHEMNVQEQKHRNQTGKCFFGEVRPGVKADNIPDALEVAREMARALGVNDVHDGESLYDFERRVFGAWTDHEAPFLNRKTQHLSPGWGKDYWEDHCGGFDKCWKPLPGAKKRVDVSSLPRLPAVPEPHKPPTPVETPEETPSDEQIRQTGHVQLLHQFGLDLSISKDARRYLEGGQWQ